MYCERETCRGPKPIQFEVCAPEPCPLEEHSWQKSAYTSVSGRSKQRKFDLSSLQCSVKCGGGVQRRQVWCEHASGKVVSDAECTKVLSTFSYFSAKFKFSLQTPKPDETRDCHMPSCSPTDVIKPAWSFSKWAAVRTNHHHHRSHHSHSDTSRQQRIRARFSAYRT